VRALPSFNVMISSGPEHRHQLLLTVGVGCAFTSLSITLQVASVMTACYRVELLSLKHHIAKSPVLRDCLLLQLSSCGWLQGQGGCQLSQQCTLTDTLRIAADRLGCWTTRTTRYTRGSGPSCGGRYACGWTPRGSPTWPSTARPCARCSWITAQIGYFRRHGRHNARKRVAGRSLHSPQQQTPKTDVACA
jgi:hypothetical protein